MEHYSGYAQTVTGQVAVRRLGVTLCHEHLAIGCDPTLWLAKSTHEPSLTTATTATATTTTTTTIAENCFSMENLANVRQRPYCYLDNMAYCGAAVAEAVEYDLHELRRAGGGTVVDVTCQGLRRDASYLQRLSQATGINVICGTGYYVSCFQSSSTLSMSTEQMFSEIVKELTEGCSEAPDIKAGIIGEVGSNWPINDFERRAIEATAMAQASTGAPVSFHPGRDPASPAEIIRIFQEAGGSAERSAMGHLERTLQSERELVEFADQCACYCELDLFGTETSYYQLAPYIDMPSDAQRLQLLKALADGGHEDRLLLSHDIHSKHRLKKFGGHGLSHILNNVVPVMMIKGFKKEVIDKMLVTNPQRFLAFSSAV